MPLPPPSFVMTSSCPINDFERGTEGGGVSGSQTGAICFAPFPSALPPEHCDREHLMTKRSTQGPVMT